jgi:N utilization substance protein A
MAKRVSKKSALAPEVQAWRDARDFFQALDELEEKRGIKKEYMMEKIRLALVSAYEKNFNTKKEPSEVPEGEQGEGAAPSPSAESTAAKRERGLGLVVIMDEEKKTIRMLLKREVVEVMDDPECEIALEDVQKILPNARLGDIVSKEIKPKNFGRIAAQTARQVVIQGVREAERNMVYDRFKGLKGEILYGLITRIDNRSGVIYVRVNSNGMGTDAQLLPIDQREDERYEVGQRIQVYIADVKQGTRHGTQILASRTHAALVRRLFEQEVPEIHDGIVLIDSIAREAGKRTKIAVHSQNAEVDPIGACVGTSGARVNAIVEQLRGEKMDIIQYSADPAQYIAAALSPSDVISVNADPEAKTCRVVVPDDQLSLAIGKMGQNARLAARLTGYKIDIKSLSASLAEPEEEEVLPEEPEDLPPLTDDDLPAEEAFLPEEAAADESAPEQE